MTNSIRRALGLMSGTSLDGIDVAFVETDGRDRVNPGASLTLPYDEGLRARLRSVLGGEGPVAEVERALTDAHGAAVREFLALHPVGKPDVVGFHGHTILHRPLEGRTWQIGDGARLSAQIGIDVVCDFRSADIAAGGEGAPLAPLFHAGLAAGLEKPLAILNLGGVANVTWLGTRPGDILAFDTGPGNALIDDWVRRHTGRSFDDQGALARAGRPDERVIARFLAHPFFARRPPKSLDRDDFAAFQPDTLGPADGAATLVAMTAAAVACAAEHFPAQARRWLVTGGGRHNSALMARLGAALNAPVEPVEAVGWDGDGLEAHAFGYLAVRSLDGLPLSLPSTTGVKRPVTGGRLCRVA
jgi:anhydro-N-acetylmuramic acid kinase